MFNWQRYRETQAFLAPPLEELYIFNSPWLTDSLPNSDRHLLFLSFTLSLSPQLPFQLGSSWNLKPNFLSYKQIIPTSLFTILGHYPMSYMTHFRYFPIPLSFQLGSLSNFKLNLLYYKPIIQTCLFPIWVTKYPMSYMTHFAGDDQPLWLPIVLQIT